MHAWSVCSASRLSFDIRRVLIELAGADVLNTRILRHSWNILVFFQFFEKLNFMKEKENAHAEYDNSIKDHRKPKYLFRFGIFRMVSGVVVSQVKMDGF